ncbi:deoxynucleotidyltransferase terminal-interacting protein 2 [Gouania willdenowi]|uniref:Fcf2 pre-rRNA processing C-terminal domain-containing protein n=1 Tax=Gouania willdenowi TaxID=441366 RepID=A0A8C5EFA5_GOUWI|nr:deoxynucleotidyltransferase terminal-interacting protein 2 [Gouania willdenowi]
MVATRRGARTTSSGKGTPDRSSEVQATPSTPRRSRRAVNQSESRSQQVPPETCCHVEEAQLGSPSRRRCTRASRLHSPEQPSTPIGSTHDGDVSDLESCSSVVSANEALLTRSRRKRTQLQPEIQENEEVSEVESCSSVLSASKNNQSIRRSTRRRAVVNIFDASNADSADGKKEAEHETEFELKRVTRSQRRPPRSSTKPLAEESELSDADSCASSVSGADVSKSASHRITRSRRMICPIPIQLDELTEGCSPPPVTTSRQTKSPRRKAAAVDVTETQSCDSDGYESGPAYPGGPRRSVRTRATASKAVDSESQLFEVHSPVSMRSRATPCSSRTGSSSSRNAPTSTQTAVSVEPAEEEDSFNESRLETTVIDDADCTLQEEEKSHVAEEPGEYVGTTDVENGDDVTTEVISHDEPPSERVVCSTEEPAVTSHHQQEEPPAEEKSSEVEKLQENVESSEPAKLCQSVTVTKCEEESEVFEESEEKQEVLHLALEKEEKEEAVNSGPREEEEKMDVSVCGVDVQQQEEEESTEASSSQQEATEEPDSDQHPKQEKTISLLDSTDDEDEEEEDKMEVTVCGAAVQQDEEEEESTEASSSQREVTEEPDADQHPKQEKTISLLGGTDDEDDEEKMEASVCGADVQQEEEESNQASSSQEDVTEEPDSDQHSKQEKTISLLDSTDDEDDDQEEESGEEEQEVPEEEPQGESSKRSDAASSVDGLFMIDTRPGQEADKQYYKELNQEETTGEEVERQKKKEEEEDEEFVDEEADDDEDEDANVLFSGRIPHLKDLSSRIDPGISVKQLGGLYISFDGSKSKIASLQKQKEKKIQEQLMKKSVIGPDFEKKDAVPPYSESKRALKLKRKTEREKSTGDAWFDMKAPEMTQELKGDLQVLKMRGSLDPKRFYKKNDRDGFPKYFQVGTVVDNPVDFYHSRMPKKARKRTMVEELLSDADFRQKNKRKYMDIMAEKAAQSAGKRRFKKNTFNKK